MAGAQRLEIGRGWMRIAHFVGMSHCGCGISKPPRPGAIMQKVSAKSSSAVWAHKKALRVSTP
eukprot:CAMPEP_0174365944 /NCGR_PEP_ID=MMETSP0811_2-20130205/79194_1 /TAXON_ID=73025 ORGANISM="Eutreptiella gymnastica-like, Strain CCMP1594" /NCGR_SAMPLE_ID=MMETSP0811_2 /ASSEMBLY_ACC=CAM_ASM_000667 /LENGTH=62 /DNA_ID=CAMNT_0015507029 /DNA_START=184 /DNA_END=369 /DNA_ORIENTATION=+